MANSRQRTRKRHRGQAGPISTGKQLLIGFFVLFTVLTFSALYVLEAATKPFSTIENHAIEVAKDYAGVTEVSQVTQFNGKVSYYTVYGKNETGQEVYVLIPESSSEIFVYQVSEGISQADAERRAQENGATTIEKTVLGYQDGHAIWEVKAGLSYYLIDFKTGELMKKEGL